MKLGKKLYILELQKDEIDYDSFAEAAQIAPQSNDELDPLEKVVKWRKDLNKPSSTRPHVPHSMNVDESIYSNVPSGYGSNSTSPTPFVGTKKAVSSERSSFEERSPGDLDSGCPGSERSPSILTNVNVPMTRHLSHVEEE